MRRDVSELWDGIDLPNFSIRKTLSFDGKPCTISGLPALRASKRTIDETLRT
jgi:hypothetical protein